MSEGQAIIDALKSENDSIKKALEFLNAEREALKQTVNEVIQTNTALKAGAFILEKRVQEEYSKVEERASIIRNLEKEISSLKDKISLDSNDAV